MAVGDYRTVREGDTRSHMVASVGADTYDLHQARANLLEDLHGVGRRGREREEGGQRCRTDQLAKHETLLVASPPPESELISGTRYTSRRPRSKLLLQAPT